MAASEIGFKGAERLFNHLGHAEKAVFGSRRIGQHIGALATAEWLGARALAIDEEAGTATCRSTYTVFQQVPGSALQPVASGRYHDRFEKVDGAWRFSQRDFTMLDLIGDLSRHLTIDPP